MKILKKLKEETRTQHERLENRLDLLNHVTNIDAYQILLEKFYGFYAPIEPKIFLKIQIEESNFDFSPRRKTPLLEKDLAALGLSEFEIGNLPVCTNLPDVSTLEEIFGYLYVAEGSTLGGQIISRHLAETWRLNANNGAAFFSGYGLETGKIWREFQLSISTFAESHSANVIVESAVETFEKLENWLFQK